MGTPTTITVVLAAASSNNICTSQTPSGAGNLTINGAAASGGVATITSATGVARQVLITPAGADAGRTFTLYGTDANGDTISEAVAGANNPSTSTSVGMYKTITRIAVDAATAGAITVGTNGVGASAAIPIDYRLNPVCVGIGTVLTTGSANWTVQETFTDFYNTTPTAFAAASWISNSGLTSKSATTDGSLLFPVVALRLLINSGTGTVAFTVIQAQQGGP